MINIRKNVLTEIADAYERANRKRNIILMVTIAFSIMVLFLLMSLVSGRVKADDIKRIREKGSSASAILENVSEEQYESLSELNYVDEIGMTRNFGSWYKDKFIAGCVMMSEEDFEKMYLPAFDNVEGSFPDNPDEIMVSVRILNSLGIEEPEIGMEIPVYIVPYNWLQSGADDIDMIFKLSGYYTDYIVDVDKLPIVFFSGKYAERQEIYFFRDNALIKSDSLWMNSSQMEKQFYLDIPFENNQNLVVLNEGALQTIRSMAGSCVFALFGILLILLSMNLFIYNIFSISINKDRRQYGLLKVVGAEPKQVRRIFILQELKIILSGCVLGIVLGSFVVVFFLPGLLEKMYLSVNGSMSHADLYSWKLLAAAVLLSGIGIVAAFESCIRTVMRLSPIECSKYEEKIRISPQKYKSAKGRGIAGIAWRNFTRNRRKMFITIVSLFIGIEVFLLAVFISNGLDQTHRIEQEPDFEIGVTKEAIEYYIRVIVGMKVGNDRGRQLVPEEMISEITKISGVNNDSIKRCIGGFGILKYDDSESIRPRIDSWRYDAEIITEWTVQVVSDEWIDDLENYVKKRGYSTDINSFREGNGFILLHDHELSPQQSENAEMAIGKGLSGTLFEEKKETPFRSQTPRTLTEIAPFPDNTASQNDILANIYCVPEEAHDMIKLY